MELAQNTLRDLAGLIVEECGIVLGDDKAYLVRHRLEPLVLSEGLPSFEKLVERLRSHGATRLRNALVDAITVKETQFFRDQGFFDALRKEVLPACAARLGRNNAGRHSVRIWSAAASTGQEAYSLAILIREFVESSKPTTPDANPLGDNQFSIIASDISAEAIVAAKAGEYSKAEVHRGLSEARLHKHFRHHGPRYRIEDSLRRGVQFRTFNLLHPIVELGVFDLILCRNVMIYFDEPTRRKVIAGLFNALQPAGWLALGSAESLYGMEDRFETVMLGKTILYKKPARA